MKLSKTKFKESKYCPKCHKQYAGYPAISRRDNKTQICSKCGQIEALEAVWKWRTRTMEKLKRWVEVQIIYYKKVIKNASCNEEQAYLSAKIEALESVLNEIEILDMCKE